MYRRGPIKFCLAALVPANAMAILHIDGTLGGVKIIMIVLEVFLFIWLATMATLAALTFFMKKKVDVRAPRVVRPERPARSAENEPHPLARGLPHNVGTPVGTETSVSLSQDTKTISQPDLVIQ
jgi:hypothetical protein